MAEYMLERAPRSPDGTIYHNMGEPLIWVDGYYMLPPFLAVAGYPSEAVRQIEGLRRVLWNPGERLFHHIWDEEHHSFKRPQHWGVGNGWAAAGMTRVVAALPDDKEDDKVRLAGYVRETIDGCLERMRPDGLFHDTLDDAGSFVETNTGQMLAYAIFRGVRAGWLPRNYLERAERLRQAAIGKVDAIGLVRDVCGAPNFDRPGTAVEGQAFHILMEAAYDDMQASSA